MGIESLEVKLSGGAANADPALSTGGAMSTTAVLSQTTTLNSISGVAVSDAAGNAVGTGSLSYTAAGKTLTWTPPGDTVGTPVYVGANGTYIIRGGNPTSGYLLVGVTSASLPATTNYTRSVVVANRGALFLPAVTKDTALAGATEYYLYYLNNAGTMAVKSVSVQIETDTPGLDTLFIAAISAKNTTELLAAASGHTYSAVGADVAMGDLAASDYWGFWIKRVVPSGTVDGVTSNSFKLRFTTLT